MAYDSDIQSRSAFPEFSLLLGEENAKQLNHEGFEVFQTMSPVIAAPHQAMANGSVQLLAYVGGEGLCKSDCV